MVSRGLGRFRVASAKKRELPNTSLPLPHPATPINLTTSRTKSLSHRSSAGDPAPASKPSGLDQALKLIHPRTLTISKAKLKLAPSGAIVFTPAQSQESLGSPILPEIPALQPKDSSTARPQSTPVQGLQIPDTASSSSFDSVRSLQSSVPRVRVTEYEKQRRYNFLGRHPPPIQRRSTSLPRILENQPPTPSSPRQALFLGGPTNRTRPGYTKVPRFVPLEIRLNPSVAMENIPACVLYYRVHNIEECDVVPGDHCHQRVSLDSSRSTRGGSEVPRPKDNLLNEREAFPLSEAKGVVKSVGNKFMAVFGKGKENKGPETENPDRIFHSYLLRLGIISLILDARIGTIPRRNAGLALSSFKPEVVHDHSYFSDLQ